MKRRLKMADKTPLDDDELDAVTGGVEAHVVNDCNDVKKIDPMGAKSCTNCYMNGRCIHQ